jgi:DNA-binding ferritin-like protein (Dps family)
MFFKGGAIMKAESKSPYKAQQKRINDQARRYILASKELDEAMKGLLKASNRASTAKQILDTLDQALATGQTDLFDDVT